MRMVTWDVNYLYSGKLLPKRYDWTNDPKGYKTEGHIPYNRCFHCGFKFIDSKTAAFCNICDHAMQTGGDDYIRGFSYEKRDARIRIPDDTNEEDYKKKIETPPERPKAVFTRADDLVDMME